MNPEFDRADRFADADVGLLFEAAPGFGSGAAMTPDAGAKVPAGKIESASTDGQPASRPVFSRSSAHGCF
jgi:hypothetical protein